MANIHVQDPWFNKELNMKNYNTENQLITTNYQNQVELTLTGGQRNTEQKKMKTLLIHFKVAGYCSMEIEVPDDYQIPNTYPRAFWEDLCQRFPDKIETDIVNCSIFGVEDQDLGGFYIDQMVLDYIQRIYIYQQGKDDIRINLDPISFDK